MKKLISLIDYIGKSELNQVFFYLPVIFIFYLIVMPETGYCKSGKTPFDFNAVASQAEKLANAAYKAATNRAPEFLRNLGYDQWRDIRFKSNFSPWHQENLPFEIQFFHLGFYYALPVEIYTVNERVTSKFPFSAKFFDYGQNQFETDFPENLGYGGFRIHYNINQPDYKDEFAVFLGASYFRGIGKNMQYGLSARGLAIDTGLDSGEEFPRFSKFWIVKPSMDAEKIVVFALLESKSYTGAYKFTIHPGEQTTMDVRSRIYQRHSVAKLGIAPLTSMFFYGENSNCQPYTDYRPEVHDSDGLLIHQANGEWIWQPIQNPEVLSISSFEATNPSGFGLLQRDREFDHYQDLEANYHNRPSAWIKATGGDWGKGRIELIMIPSDKEINDNVVAFWVPETGNKEVALSFSYELSWYQPVKSPHGGGIVNATFTTADKKEKTRTFLVDFKGGGLDELGNNAYPGARVDVGENISIVEQQVQKNSYINGWRMMLKIRGKDKSTLEKVFESQSEPINLRAYLHMGEDVLSETWSYIFYP